MTSARDREGGGDGARRLEQAIATTLRAIAGEKALQVRFGAGTPGLAPGVARLPFIGHASSPREIARVRGMADRMALRIAFHDAELHARQAPRSARGMALFDAVEEARLEAIGARAMPGMATNMQQELQARLQERRADARAANAEEELAEALGLVVREKLAGLPPPPAARALVERWRAHIEAHAGAILEDLEHRLHDQAAFAQAARDIVLALDPGAAQMEEEPEDVGQRPEEDADPGDVGGGQQSDMENEREQERETAGRGSPAEEARETPRLEDAEASGTGNTQGREEAAASVPLPMSNEPDPDGYRVFTTEFDEVVRADELAQVEELQRLRAQLDSQLTPLQGMVARLANRLQRLLLAQQNRSWEFDLDEGILDAARLARVVADPLQPLSFKREREAAFRDTVVGLLIDNSGSMRGRPITIAAVCTDILARTLERCGVKVEILGFTTSQWKGGKARQKWLGMNRPPKPGRLNDLRHIIYKPADVPWRRARLNIGLMLREGLLKENIDGEALIWAHQRLLARPEQRRILMVISDGAPVDDSTLTVNDSAYLERHLKAVIADIEAHSPVELAAIGIGHDVTRHYRRAITIHDVEGLGAAMTRQLTELFAEREGHGRGGALVA